MIDGRIRIGIAGLLLVVFALAASVVVDGQCNPTSNSKRPGIGNSNHGRGGLHWGVDGLGASTKRNSAAATLPHFSLANGGLWHAELPRPAVCSRCDDPRQHRDVASRGLHEDLASGEQRHMPMETRAPGGVDWRSGDGRFAVQGGPAGWPRRLDSGLHQDGGSAQPDRCGAGHMEDGRREGCLFRRFPERRNCGEGQDADIEHGHDLSDSMIHVQVCTTNKAPPLQLEWRRFLSSLSVSSNRVSLALGVGGRLAGTLEARLLAFLDASISRQQSELTQ